MGDLIDEMIRADTSASTDFVNSVSKLPKTPAAAEAKAVIEQGVGDSSGHGRIGRSHSGDRRRARNGGNGGIRSKSASRKQRSTPSSNGTAHTNPSRRTSRRVAATEKQWGNASSPSIRVRDVMGSVKKSTEVGMVPSTSSSSTRPKTRDAKTGAAEKRNQIHSRWREKNTRQKNIHDSLSNILTGDLMEEDDFLEEIEDDEIDSEEDETILKPLSSLSVKKISESDVEDETPTVPRDGKTSRRKSSDGIVSEDCSFSKRSIRRQRKTKEADVNLKEGSRRSHSQVVAELKPKQRSASTRRRQPDRSLRRRANGADDDDRSVASAKSTRRRPHRKKDDATDDRSVSSAKSSKRRIGKSKQNNYDKNDDERSVGSKKSVGGRRRRNQSTRNKKASTLPVVSTVPPEIISANAEINTGEMSKEAYALARHLRDTDTKKSKVESECSDESSHCSEGYDQPASLIQFDPSNMHHFTLVKQNSKALVTSEKFKRSNGTESEVNIREFKMANMPSFETEIIHCDESDLSNDSEERPQSARSLGSIEKTSEENTKNRGHKSVSNLAFFITPKRGPRRGVNQSGARGRGVSKTQSAGIPRVSTGRRDRSSKHGTGTQGGLHQSIKGFMGRWNKHGECESENEDETGDQTNNHRFFRRREDTPPAHQMLDDYGSD